MTATTSSRPTTAVRAVRATATAAVVVLGWQFVTAGQILPRGGPLELHAAGAIVLHVVTGLAALATLLLARTDREARWPAALAATVFVLTFVQAWTGDEGILAVHVPGAIVVTVGSVWLAAWAWMRAGA